MDHIFIDTNVIIDFLTDRKPFSDSAEIILYFSEKKKLMAYVSSITFNNCYYIVRKYEDHNIIINKLNKLAEIVEILDVTKEVIINSLHSQFEDFEDSIQYYTARQEKMIKKIITRNVKDFKYSELQVLTPSEYIITSNLLL